MDDETKIIGVKVSADTSPGVSGFRQLDDASTHLLDGMGRLDKGVGGVETAIRSLATAMSALAIGEYVRRSVDAANQVDRAATGLAVTARYTGQSIEEANRAAKELASDGLMSVAEASKGLQNLLSRGFSLEEAVRLMNAFRDSAAFGRQSSLEFGEAVVSATEGIKNENSILVDNAGVTKNVSVMWKEYAAQHGKTVDSLTQSEKRQAELNGVLLEAEGQMGNAARMTETFAGAQARLSQEIFNANAAMGRSLMPVLGEIAKGLVPVVQGFRDFVGGIQMSAVSIAAFVDKWKALHDAGGLLGIINGDRRAQMFQRWDQIDQAAEEQRGEIFKRLSFDDLPSIGTDPGRRRQDVVLPPKTSEADRRKLASEAERLRKEGAEFMEQALADFYRDQEERYREAATTGNEMIELFFQSQIDKYKKGAEYLNPQGVLTDEQQAAFDQRSTMSYWEARNAALDRGAGEIANQFSAMDDPLAQTALQLDQEQQYYIDHWAMLADNEIQYQERVSAIEAFYSEKRKGLLRQEEVSKLNGTMQYTNATANLFGSLYEVSGKKLKAFFFLQQAANASSAVMSGYKAGAAALEPPPIGLGPVLGGPLSAIMIAGGFASAASIMAQTVTGPSGGGAGSANYGGGTPTSPVVTQPQFQQSQQQGDITIVLKGIPNGKYIEEELIPGLNEAGSRNIRIEYLN